MKSMLHIGHSKQAVREVRKAINDILASKQDQATIQAALETFSEATRISASVEHCKFTAK